VAKLPRHAHLLAEPGCFVDYGKPKEYCGPNATEKGNRRNTALPDEFLPIPYNEGMHRKWVYIIRKMLRENKSTQE